MHLLDLIQLIIIEGVEFIQGLLADPDGFRIFIVIDVAESYLGLFQPKAPVVIYRTVHGQIIGLYGILPLVLKEFVEFIAVSKGRSKAEGRNGDCQHEY